MGLPEYFFRRKVSVGNLSAEEAVIQASSLICSAIALNASYFNAQRVVTQYFQNAYRHQQNINVMSK